MLLVVGLGNPGPAYAKTRHNVGFMVIDALIKELKPQDISKNSFKGHLYKSNDLLLLKPSTFMNLSGESVIEVKNFYKPQRLVVVHDDIDLALGALRFKIGGSSGGHNGLKSLDSHIGNDYIRVRIGIGRPALKEEVVKYVLQNFTKEEESRLQTIIESAKNAILALKNESLNRVQERYSLKG